MNTSADLLRELRINHEPEPVPSRRRLWIALATIVAVLLFAGGTWAFSSREQGIEVRTAPVVTISDGVSQSSVLDASGYVVARRIATVSAKVTGRVREMFIEEGQFVQADEVLATLDPIDADAQHDLASAQLAAARSQIGIVQAQLVEAESNAERLGSLVEQQLVSKSEYEQGFAQRDALRAQLSASQSNARVAAQQARIASIGVDNTVVHAPFAGVVIAKSAQPGEIISPLSAGGFTRTGIGTIVDMDSLEVEVDVSEAFIGRVEPKMPVEATLNAYPGWRIPAEVIAIIPAADRGKATVKVRIALKQNDPRIVPEMGVRVSFLDRPSEKSEDQPEGVRVPRAAIVERDGVTVAFALRDVDTVELRTLRTGDALTDDRQVLSGLKAGETVVLDPPDALMDGGKVRTAE